MGWTKRQFVTQAFDEIGIASYTFDLRPEQFDSALKRLDALMAQWNAMGIRLSYPIPSSPENSDLDTETGVPDSANEAIYTNLAIRIAPSYGKVASAETRVTAHAGYRTLIARAALPPEMRLPCAMPIGAGNSAGRLSQPFTPPPADSILVGQDSVLDFN